MLRGAPSPVVSACGILELPDDGDGPGKLPSDFIGGGMFPAGAMVADWPPGPPPSEDFVDLIEL